MKLSIWKFPVERVADTFEVEMPEGAQILHLAMQPQSGYGEVLCLWALCDVEVRKVARRFKIRGTGHAIDGSKPAEIGAYVGTFQMHGGDLVWHLFDLGEIPE